jgi:hypothetical protein
VKKPQLVAALFVDASGTYAGLDGVELWDEQRDARTYPGPWPVVAHPPCGRWCRLAHAVEGRYPHFKVGDDGGTFAAALEAVRRWGGVLEHPAWTKAWEAYQLRTPWKWGGRRSLRLERPGRVRVGLARARRVDCGQDDRETDGGAE